MQCAECRAVYSESLDVCPQCQAAAPRRSPERRAAHAEARRAAAPNGDSAHSHAGGTATATSAAATAHAPSAASLIEFPGGRPRPQWRKDLSERVREIQQRRAREAALEQEAALAAQGVVAPPQTPAGAPALEVDDEASRGPALGLVPQVEAPAVNPIVAAALKRLERARQPPAPRPRAKGGAATAAAVAYEAEESYRPEAAEPVRAEAAPPTAPQARPAARASAPPAAEAKPAPESQKARQTPEAARAAGLVVLSAPPSVKIEPTVELPRDGMNAAVSAAPVASELPPTAAETKPAARVSAAAKETPAVAPPVGSAEASLPSSPLPKTRHVVAGTSSRVLTERREAEITDAANSVPVVESASVSDRAPVGRRVAAGVVDLLVAALCSVPCAAIIELTSSRWDDPRVLATMGGIALLVTFLYFVVSTGLFGRTFGMSLFGLRAVDARNALVPTTGQSTRRALFYMLSLATFGLGLVYAFFDAEGRTAHDHLSGTIVVKE